MNFGATIIDQKNTILGTAGQQFLNADRDPIPANGGFAGKSYTRDARGELLQTTFEDASGNPVAQPDGTTTGSSLATRPVGEPDSRELF